MPDLPRPERRGCCADWPKPCSYHEGWQDGIDALTARLEAAEKVVEDLSSFTRTAMFCVLCQSPLDFSGHVTPHCISDTPPPAGHEPDCALAAYDAVVEGQS